MKTKLLLWCATGWLVALTGAQAATLYVDAASTNAVPPFANWANAAANIQDAVDAAAPGDEIVVTDGVYQTGARAVYGMSNRVAVTKAVTVRSLNGPEVTSIVGAGPVGATAIRCVYLTNGAVLAGFTLTNGATQMSDEPRVSSLSTSGGGLWCESQTAVVTNCVIVGNSAFAPGGGAYSGTLNHCTLLGNLAIYGGGAARSTLNHCTLTGNLASSGWTSSAGGGGAAWSTLTNCTLVSNSADSGGAVYESTLEKCILASNSAGSAGGANWSTLINCIVTGNSAQFGAGGVLGGTANNCTITSNFAAESSGGGAHAATLNNCIITGNSAGGFGGGGAFWSTLNNCTLAGNKARNGGGVAWSTLTNCIVYYNSNFDFDDDGFEIADNYNTSTINYSCTTPAPGSGVGNITNAPLFVDTNGWSNLRLQSTSPCINAGNNAYVVGNTDLDDHPRIVGGAVDIGAFEWQGTTRYVSAASTNPIAPYSSWESAAVTIQDAVDAAAPGDEIVVTNGVYQTGARTVYGMSNRVAVTKPVTVRSLNGPAVTSIVGSGPNGPTAVRCVFMTDGAVLSGFTLTNGATQTDGDPEIGSVSNSGGGVWCPTRSPVVTNCVLTANSAYGPGGGAFGNTLNNCTLTGNSATWGAGAAGSTLNNCTLTGNLAGDSGGGAVWSTLNNCTLMRNFADFGEGSGAAWSMLSNCVVYYNGHGEGNYSGCEFNYSCTTPNPGSGVGNITAAPLFVDTNGWSNLRLQSNSPCINAGHNASVATSTDLDGRPRLVGGLVDMGAYEYQGPGTGEFIGWLQQFGLPTDGSADGVDTDHDVHNNWQEWMAGTVPTDALSALRLASPVITPTNVTFTWASVTNRTYTLEQATNLGDPSAFSVLRSNLAGLPGTTSWTDTNAPVASPRFYQLRVSP